MFYNHYTLSQQVSDMGPERQREVKNDRLWKRVRKAAGKRTK